MPMRSAANIRIESLIIHITDVDRPVLSDIPLQADVALLAVAYFRDHIAKGLADTQARAARFELDGPDSPHQDFHELLGASAALVPVSQRLARRMIAIMAGDRRVARGDLAFCVCVGEVDGGEHRFVAVLKLDATSAFRPVGRRDARTDMHFVDLEAVSELLPTAGERLQKCAFVRARPPDGAYDMLLVDRQRRGADDAQVARFFTQRFLGAKAVWDARQSTTEFYRTAIGAVRAAGMDPEAAREVTLQAQAALAGRHVNVDRWLAELDVPPQAQAVFQTRFQAAALDTEFDVDRTTARSVLRRLHFEGACGLRVTVDAEAYDDVVRGVRPVELPGGGVEFEVVLRTSVWKQVLR